jgi:hypothetical protein
MTINNNDPDFEAELAELAELDTSPSLKSQIQQVETELNLHTTNCASWKVLENHVESIFICFRIIL